MEVVERLAAEPVELVHEREDRDSAPAADLEELAGLGLDSLGAVDQHHRGIGGSERPVGVFGEVLVARRVEQVDAEAAVLELQHRARHRDPALPLQLHPVGGDMPLGAARLHRSGEVDGAAVEEQLLGERRLPGVRMGDDRKRPATRRFRFELLFRLHVLEWT